MGVIWFQKKNILQTDPEKKFLHLVLKIYNNTKT